MVDAATSTFVLITDISLPFSRLHITNHSINIQHRPIANMTIQIPQSIKQRKKKGKKIFCDSTNKVENNKKIGVKLKEEWSRPNSLGGWLPLLIC